MDEAMEQAGGESVGPRGMRTFLLLWAGQIISLVGTELTGFSLGVWIYRETGSVTQFSLIILATVTPSVLLSPFAGALIDRADRRLVMILSNVGSALGTLAIALLFFTGALRVWHVWVLMSLISASSAFLLPAYSASVALLVPKRHLGRASGMVQFGQAAAEIVSPLLAGFLVLTIGVHGVLLIDFATYGAAVATLLFARVPRPAPVEGAERAPLLRDVLYGWRYLRERPGLLALMLLFTLTNFTLGVGNALTAPLILSFADASVYGRVMAAAGTGIFLGSLLMAVWGGPRRRIGGVYAYGFVLGAGLALEGLRPDALLVACALFATSLAAPVANGCVVPILQSKTPPHVQGRVFATVRFMAGWSVPLAYLLAGSLADRFFEPLMAAGGPLASSVGAVIGVGPGRGIALMLVLAGALTAAATTASYFYQRLRRVEEELPDALPDGAQNSPPAASIAAAQTATN
jgi:DHA3 family macrolide efflux protein-like MFS transporter